MRGAVAVIFLSCVSLTLLGKYVMKMYKVASYLHQTETVKYLGLCNEKVALRRVKLRIIVRGDENENGQLDIFC